MARDEMIEELWQASQSGATLRKEWLDEFVRQPGAKKRMQDLMLEADEPTRSALASLLGEFADAPRQNASKKRRKTTEPNTNWQRELAAHLHREGPSIKRAKYLHIPQEHDAEPLSLCDGKFEVTRSGNINLKGDEGPRIRCTFDDGTAPSEITFSTFEKYLKQPKPAKKSGAVSG